MIKDAPWVGNPEYGRYEETDESYDEDLAWERYCEEYLPEGDER